MRIIFDDLEPETDMNKYIEQTLKLVFTFFAAVVGFAIGVYLIYVLLVMFI